MSRLLSPTELTAQMPKTGFEPAWENKISSGLKVRCYRPLSDLGLLRISPLYVIIFYVNYKLYTIYVQLHMSYHTFLLSLHKIIYICIFQALLLVENFFFYTLCHIIYIVLPFSILIFLHSMDKYLYP